MQVTFLVHERRQGLGQGRQPFGAQQVLEAIFFQKLPQRFGDEQ